MYGTREFVLFYLTAAVVSSLMFIGLDLYTGDDIPAIGASGAVMGVVMLFACHFPGYTMRFWGLIPIEIRWLVLLYVLFDLHPVLLRLSGDDPFTGVAHACHLGGLAFGYFYYRKRLRLAPVLERLQSYRWKKLWRGSKGLKIHRPASGARQSQVDALLTKISESGGDSLTPEELQLLKEESERLKRRRQ
jgi:Rhomboid family